MIALAFLLTLLTPPEVGPPNGALVIVGGGKQGPEITRRFVELAGGPDAEFVMIPTANEGDAFDLEKLANEFRSDFGVNKVKVLHTRDKAEADRDEFVAPLKTAKGVWFGGGRQWRYVDSYLGTRTQREIEAVLARGGVIGGSSAGATIQGSYLVRGAREGNLVMMAKGYEVGFGYLKNVAIDQHVIARNRLEDMPAVIDAHPNLLGLGIDEGTAIVVEGDQFEVLGRSKVAVYDGKEYEGKKYRLLSKGDRFDFKTRETKK